MSEDGEAWSVVCTDRGQHRPHAMFNRLYARMSDGQVTSVVGIPRLRAENLGARSRSEREYERELHEDRLVDAPRFGASRFAYPCTVCGRDTQLRQESIVRALNGLLAANFPGRVLDVSYLG